MGKKEGRPIMPMSTAGNLSISQKGFTYLMVLVAVIAVGILAESATIYASKTRQLDVEAELLFRGMAYRNAIKSYYQSGNPQKFYPKSLDDLIRDPRTVSHRSHIRMLYTDPVTNGKASWKLIRAPDGGILGVASSSTAKPVKTGNFRKEFQSFENAKSYADWIFEYVPEAAPAVVAPIGNRG